MQIRRPHPEHQIPICIVTRPPGDLGQNLRSTASPRIPSPGLQIMVNVSFGIHCPLFLESDMSILLLRVYRGRGHTPWSTCPNSHRVPAARKSLSRLLSVSLTRIAVFVFLFLTSLCMTDSRSIHLTTHNAISFLFMAE